MRRPDVAEIATYVESRRGVESAISGRHVHPIAVGALTVLAAAGYSVYSMVRFATFHSNTYDLVIFDQAVRSYAHLRPGLAIVKGVHNGFGPNFSVLGDHWSPILALLAPLYWIHDGPQTLLIAQSALFALAIPPLWVVARRSLGSRSAYLVAAVYALSWPIAQAVAFDFHEVAFVPVLTAVAVERFQAGRLRSAGVAAATLLLVKEDMGLLIAGFGLVLLVSRTSPLAARVPRQADGHGPQAPAVTPSRRRVLGVAMILAGLTATWISARVLVPAFGGRTDYYWAYGRLGANVGQAAGHALAHPLDTARLLVTPRIKMDTLLWLFGAFVFLPLLSPVSLAAVPLLLERMLASSYPNWWGVSYHYNAFIVVVLVCAAIDGAARLGRISVIADKVRRRDHVQNRERSTAWVGRASAVVAFAAAICLVPRFAFGAASHSSFYRHDTSAQAAAIAAVPDRVMVEASQDTGPHLSSRTTVLLWDGTPRWAPWVVAKVDRHTFPFAGLGDQFARVRLLESNGYRVVLQRGGYVVLERGATK